MKKYTDVDEYLEEATRWHAETVELLSTYLAELSGFPIATPTHLDDADKALLDKLGSTSSL
jgi:hypothetical protein